MPQKQYKARKGSVKLIAHPRVRPLRALTDLTPAKKATRRAKNKAAGKARRRAA